VLGGLLELAVLLLGLGAVAMVVRRWFRRRGLVDPGSDRATPAD